MWKSVCLPCACVYPSSLCVAKCLYITQLLVYNQVPVCCGVPFCSWLHLMHQLVMESAVTHFVTGFT